MVGVVGSSPIAPTKAFRGDLRVPSFVMGRIRDRDGRLHPTGVGCLRPFLAGASLQRKDFPHQHAARRCDASASPNQWIASCSGVSAIKYELRAARREPRRRPRTISLRRHRHAMRSIAQTLGIATAMVSRVLARAGFSRLAAPDVPTRPNRHERVDCAAGFLDHASAYYGSLGHRAGPDRQRQGIRFRAVRSPM